MNINDYQRDLLLDWMRKIHRMEWSHRLEAKKLKNINIIFGSVSIIIATVIAGISTVPGVEAYIENLITSIGAILVAILSGLQTFLKPSEMAEKLGVRSGEFEALRHELEELYEFHEMTNESLLEKLKEIRSSWSNLASMNTSDRSFKKAGEIISRDGRYPQKLDLRRNDEDDQP